MPEAFHSILKYGYQGLSLLLFMEAVGFPVPGALVLLTAGAAAASGALYPGVSLALALCAMFTGDILLYLVGRYSGWALLGFLCRISLNPESCIFRAAESFYKRGRRLLLFAKFVPGINTMAPPLAGSMNMSPLTFLALDFCGAFLYATSFFLAGFVFSEFLKNILSGMQALGTAMEWLIGIAIAAYLTYRIRIAWKSRKMANGPRMEVQTVAELAAIHDDIVIADVRSHGYYDKGAMRIRGSIRLDPNVMLQTLDKIPKAK